MLLTSTSSPGSNLTLKSLVSTALYSDEDELSWDLWSGTGKPFSSAGKWNVTVQEARNISSATEVSILEL